MHGRVNWANIRRCILGALIGTGVFSGYAAAQPVELIDHSVLRVCADPSALPFSAQGKNGFENQIAELFAKDLGVSVRYTWFPSTMGFYRRTLNARRCDIVMGAPSIMEMAQSTQPYYRSTFALVTRTADQLDLHGLDDPALKGKRIGARARTPPGNLLVRYGFADNLHAYGLMVDSRVSPVGQQMAEDLLAHKIDVAVIWGPVAAYQASIHQAELSVTPLKESEDGIPLAYDIAMAVRKGEPRWRARIDRFIAEHHGDIQAILESAGVPLLPMTGEIR